MPEKLILEKIQRIRPPFEHPTVFSDVRDIPLLRIFGVRSVGDHRQRHIL